MALELHLRLVDLAQVHQFVDEGEHTVGISVDELEGLLVFGRVAALQEFLEGTDDEGHWGAELMGDVHEELQFGLVDGFLALLLSLEPTFHSLAAEELIDEPDDSCKNGKPKDGGPPGTVPGALDEDVDGLDFRGEPFLIGLETEDVFAGREAAERNEVHGRGQCLP